MREILRKWHGHEIGTEGDSFFAAFPRAKDAVSAAVEIQRRLAEVKFLDEVFVLLRIGIHTGEPWVDMEGYTGLDVHRAARITNIGHGGQVLLSETTSALIRDELPPGVSMRGLGLFHLKDMESPENIHQLVIQDLPSDFPPLNSMHTISNEGEAGGDLDQLLQTLEEAGILEGKYDLNDILRIKTFGGLTINLGAKPVHVFSSPKVEALLVYIACNQQPVPHQVLAEMLWEGRSQSLAMSNLRVARENLEKMLGDYLTINQDTMEINQESPVWLDVTVFEKLLNDGQFKSALSLYHGAFLEGFKIRSAHVFDGWVLQQRRRLNDLAKDAMDESAVGD